MPNELLVQVVPKVATIDSCKQSLAERIKAAKRAATAEEVTDDDSDSETAQTSKGVHYTLRPRPETPVLEAPVPLPLGPKDAGTYLLRYLTGLLNSKATVDNPAGERYIVDVFGSVAWGGGTGKSGDVDLVIIDKDYPLGYEPHLWRTSPLQRVTANSSRDRRTKNKNVSKIYNVHVLKQYLDDVSGFDSTKAVPAYTPIVKFDAPGLGLQFDICTNDLGGWYNSCLILAYCELSPFVLRPMIHVLKLWLESHNLNDPSGVKGLRTMSSYCITLMAIAYLQHIAVLPNLQSAVEVPASADPGNTGLENTVWVSWGKRQGDIAHIWFERHPPAGWVSAKPRVTASEAVRGFFQFFSRSASESFDPNTQLISLLNGGIISRRYPQAPGREHWVKLGRRFPGNDHVGKCDSYQCTDWDDQLLIVQDPFLWQKNCAKTLFIDKQEGRFFKHIATTHRFLKANPMATLPQLLSI
ncbi:uncharacterized protein CcaverHIS019_0309010 [Cutaneotrichosporon cavernicola]|uniref:Poly(A) RNA polymerase mitochondrial-like central palm domain-containing protein n=1 Tax=Cutaneotrichosporon cavernicola TaxID=279322 RepID=A0AA48L167_9TREE|nr:uncharacterized protein CcaverHIS019_0309010 [Cutaneotrichosporon cavernicola]BEI90831.1 hypothetical protein CcaverHIS019_0309010 [Cutaneotrichosporon cavernicola]